MSSPEEISEWNQSWMGVWVTLTHRWSRNEWMTGQCCLSVCWESWRRFTGSTEKHSINYYYYFDIYLSKLSFILLSHNDFKSRWFVVSDKRQNEEFLTRKTTHKMLKPFDLLLPLHDFEYCCFFCCCFFFFSPPFWLLRYLLSLAPSSDSAGKTFCCLVFVCGRECGCVFWFFLAVWSEACSSVNWNKRLLP